MVELEDYNRLMLYAFPWIWYLIGLYFCLPVIAYIILPNLISPNVSRNNRTVSIFVLGDLGHSPRMCYHARSFVDLEYSVNLCGYLESELPVDLVDNPGMDVFEIPVIRNTFNLPFILFAAQKMILQTYNLFQLMFSFRGTNYIMLQNPPSIPILLISIIFIKLFSRHTKLIIDWHNLNYSILNLKFNNESHPLVRILKFYEHYLSKCADIHLTVTKSMKKFLTKEFGISKQKITVLYDRPGESFIPLTKSEFSKEELLKHELFNDLDKSKKYKILMSSTSFTPDEDFGILLDALKQYDNSNNKTNIFLIVTGKGPMKDQFLQEVIAAKFLDKVIVKTAWLAIEDYPVLISMADLGISLHTSSSGIDLPMKILDFFGCGVPVISLDFPAIKELVNDKINGLIVGSKENDSTSDGLYNSINLALSDEDVYSSIKQGAMVESERRWNNNWKECLGKTFKYR